LALQMIPHGTWAWFLDRFSGAHRGERVTVEIFGPSVGTGQLARDVPLVGVSMLGSASGEHVAIVLAESEGVQLTYRTAIPLVVTFEAETNGGGVLLGIAADDETTTFLRCHGGAGHVATLISSPSTPRLSFSVARTMIERPTSSIFAPR
jgi:hypothetical protein